jgi:pimeloyl-ACP methyl ester carboxylesterase
LAVDHPGRVDRLVLVSCTNRFGPYLLEMAKLLGKALRHFPPEAYRRTIELLGTSPEYFDAHREEIEQKVLSACEDGIGRAAVARQLRCLGTRDVADGPDYRIAAPTLIIAGEQDMLIPACYGRRMSREIVGSEFLLVPGCGHNPFTEKPDFVAPRITEFLKRPRGGHRRKREETNVAVEESV